MWDDHEDKEALSYSFTEELAQLMRDFNLEKSMFFIRFYFIFVLFQDFCSDCCYFLLRGFEGDSKGLVCFLLVLVGLLFQTACFGSSAVVGFILFLGFSSSSCSSSSTSSTLSFSFYFSFSSALETLQTLSASFLPFLLSFLSFLLFFLYGAGKAISHCTSSLSSKISPISSLLAIQKLPFLILIALMNLFLLSQSPS